MTPETPAPSKRDRLQAARDRAAEARALEQRRRGRRRAIVWSSVGVGAVAVIAVVVIAVSGLFGGTSSAPTAGATLTGPAGPEGMVLEKGTLLASDTTPSTGATADGIACNAGEGSVEHIHTHLSVYVDGALRPIPIGIGVVDPSVQDPGTDDAFAQATRCYFWLHVHAADGVIHVEAPTKHTYTLGQFFAVWGQPLSSTTVAGATGKQTILVNGKVVTGDPADVALGSREDIQIDIGKVVPYQKVDWSSGKL
jgi:hypothetical protein